MERNFLAVCRFICHTECFIVMWYSANNLVYFLFKDYVNYATENVPLPFFGWHKIWGKFSFKHFNCVGSTCFCIYLCLLFWSQTPSLNDTMSALYFYVWNLLIVCIRLRTSNPL